MWGYYGYYWGFGWWIIPIAIIIMCALCFLMMRGWMGCMMCGPFSRNAGDSLSSEHSESAREILNKRHARGEIGVEEYEEKKKDIDQS